jgi:adenylate kinase
LDARYDAEEANHDRQHERHPDRRPGQWEGNSDGAPEQGVRPEIEHLDELDGKRGIVLDGFPRTNAQAYALDVALVQRGQQVNWAIYLDAPRELLVERLSGRYICKAHGHVWNIRTRPPKTLGICDLDGSPLFQRNDDTGEAVQKRLDIFFRETIHLVEYYEARSKLIHINAAKSIQEVNEAVFNALRNHGMSPVMAAQTERTASQ